MDAVPESRGFDRSSLRDLSPYELLQRVLPALFEEEISPERYRRQYGAALDAISGASGLSRKQVRKALALWEDEVKKASIRSGIELLPPPAVISVAETSDAASAEEFQASILLSEKARQWRESPPDPSVVDSHDDVLSILLVRLILGAGCFDAKVLLHVARHVEPLIIHSHQLALDSDGGAISIFWLELSLSDLAVGNCYRDSVLVNEIQLPLDPMTVPWIHKLNGLREGVEVDGIDQRALLRRVMDQLKVDGPTRRALGGLQRVLRGLREYFEHASGVPLSTYQLATASGTAPAVNLTHGQFKNLLSMPRPELDQWRVGEEQQTVERDTSLRTFTAPGRSNRGTPIDEVSRFESLAQASQDLALALARRNPKDGTKRRPGDAWRALHEIEVRADLPPIRWLARLYKSLLCGERSRDILSSPHSPKGGARKTLAVSTVLSDVHYMIGSRLLTAAESRNVDCTAAEDLQRVCSTVLSAAQETRRDWKRAISELNRFIAISSVINDDFPEIPQFSTQGGALAMRVRPALHPVTLHLRICASLRTLEGFSSVDQEALLQMWQVLFWSGCRPMELTKARVCDVEMSEELPLFVADTRFGSNKTDAGRRELRLGALMPQQERESFMRWLGERRAHADLNAPLFVQEAEPSKPWDHGKVSTMFTALMRSCGGPDDAVAYGTRHTRLTAWQFLAESELELAVGLGLFVDMAHARSVSQALLGPITSTAWSYEALAVAAGHSSAEVFCQKYAHGHALVRAAQLSRNGWCVSLDQLSALTQRRPSTCERAITASGGEVIDPQCIPMPIVANAMPVIMQTRAIETTKHARSTRATGKSARAPSPAICGRSGKEADVQPSLLLRHQMLEEWSRGADLNDLEDRYPYSSQTVLSLTRRLQRLALIPTRNKVSRVTGKFLQRDSRWIPPLPKHDEGDANAERLRSQIVQCFKKDPSRVKRVLEHYFSVCSVDASYVTFHDESSLKDFLWLMGGAIEKSRWRAEILVPEPPMGRTDRQVSRYWNPAWLTKMIRRTSVKQKASSNGVLRLRLGLPEGLDSKATKKNYSSSLLKFVLPMAAVFLLTESEIDEIATRNGLNLDEWT